MLVGPSIPPADYQTQHSAATSTEDKLYTSRLLQQYLYSQITRQTL